MRYLAGARTRTHLEHNVLVGGRLVLRPHGRRRRGKRGIRMRRHGICSHGRTVGRQVRGKVRPVGAKRVGHLLIVRRKQPQSERERIVKDKHNLAGVVVAEQPIVDPVGLVRKVVQVGRVALAVGTQWNRGSRQESEEISSG